MQDKEFDDLFHSKLRNFEVQPSAEVWQSVDAELKGKKSNVFLMLSIAATVLILLTAGILFIPEKGTVEHNKRDSKIVAKEKPLVVKSGNNQTVIKLDKKPEQLVDIETPLKHTTKVNQSGKKGDIVQRKQASQPIAEPETVNANEPPLIAATGTKKPDEVVTQEPIELTDASMTVKKAADNSAINLPSQPALALTQSAKTVKPVLKKHGIHSFGDIVNIVIAKVDKRKDKLIQFSDSDDDESVISAVHLGALKIKRDN